MSYARGTSVSVDRSQDEIKRLLRQRGADEFVTRERSDQAAIGFKLRGLHFVMSVPLPDASDQKFKLTPKRRQWRTAEQARSAFEDEVKRRWRCLVAVLKAKLVAIDDQVSTFEQEFLPYIVLPNGQTVGQQLEPAVHRAMERGDGVLMLTDQSEERSEDA